MELLLALLAELLAILAVSAGVLVVLAALAIVAALLLALVRREAAATRLRRGLRRASIVVLVVVTLGLVALQTIAAPAAIRWAIADLPARGGPRITFEDADLSLLRGALRLRGVTLDRGEDLSLRGERVAIDVDWPSLLVGDRIRVESLDLRGIRGRIHRVEGARRPPRGRPAIVDHLSLADVDVAAAVGPHTLRVQIKELRVAPLRSDRAIFDLLVAAAGRAQIDAFHLEARRQPGLTTWSIRGVPTALLGLELPPALKFLEDVALDLEIEAEHDEPIADAADLRLTAGVGLVGSEGPRSRARRLVDTAHRLARAAGFGEIEAELHVDAASLQDQAALTESALRHALQAALRQAMRRVSERSRALGG
ncbi:MAG: hypothetical protein R3B09_18240 [Nannocystaceae bacterium]